MPNFILAAKSSTAADQVVADPKAMLDAGMLTAYTERANGTTRHLELAPLGSTRRDTAEWVSERLNDGASVAAVARELHVSTSVVRRLVLALEITEDIEAGEYDELWAETNGFAAPVEQVCAPDSDCAVHGDGSMIAADQDCPMVTAVVAVV